MEICNKHDGAIVTHESDECPLCLALEKIDDLESSIEGEVQDRIESIQGQHDAHNDLRMMERKENERRQR